MIVSNFPRITAASSPAATAATAGSLNRDGKIAARVSDLGPVVVDVRLRHRGKPCAMKTVSSERRSSKRSIFADSGCLPLLEVHEE